MNKREKEYYWLSMWLNTERGRLKSRALYESVFSKLPARSISFLLSFVGSEALTAPFYIELLKLDVFDLMAVPGCGERTVLSLSHGLLEFRSLLIEAFSHDLSDIISIVLDADGHEKGAPEHDIQYLRGEIEDICDELSNHSSRVVRSIFKSVDYDVKRLYELISSHDFNVKFVRGAGVKTRPEVEHWRKKVIGLVQKIQSSHLSRNMLFYNVRHILSGETPSRELSFSS